ncbi:hypothetical protein [Pseudorhodoferax sp.]|uniref:hypothetical protein n=1 Tax=Pseudorhodoferax sp. TaxID=1993553 RepID=UPI002DD658C8|nr:hypothetical protein [Pseudorhodoferax sp.]
MAAEHFSHQLAEAEAQLDSLNQLLLQGDAPAYEAGALVLRQLIAQLAHAAHGQPTPVAPAVAARLRRLASGLAQQREQLARRAMTVSRTLAVVLPQRQPTYEAPGRRAGFSGAAPQIYSAPAR